MGKVLEVSDGVLIVDWQQMEANKHYSIEWLGKKVRVVKWEDGKVEVYERT